jgi:ssRNA-specific RNase YbeY (16S rRNA maturation enzyme)
VEQKIIYNQIKQMQKKHGATDVLSFASDGLELMVVLMQINHLLTYVAWNG